jgi:hypothetical protein
MRRVSFFALVIGAVIFFVVSAASTQEPGGVRELFVVQNSDFTTQHPGGVESFDLSPDGKTLAVEFGTHVPDANGKYGKFGVWIALWNVDTQRLVAAQQVEDDLPVYGEGYNKGLPFAKYEHNLRFSPDGRALIVLTGPRLVALSLPALKPLWALVDNPVNPDSGERQMVFTDFSVSVQADRVAVLREYIRGDLPMYNSGRVDVGSLEVIIASLSDGKVLARWGQPGHSESIALSPEGNLLALVMYPVLPGSAVIPTGENNVFLLKPNTGEVVSAFNTGYEAGDAKFLPGGEALITVPADHGAQPQFYPRDVIRIWSVATRQVTRELGYPEYGVRSPSDIAISANGEWLAVADPWHNPTDIRSDRDIIRGWVRLLVWNVPTRKLVHASDDLGPSYALQSGLPRLFGRPVLVRMAGSGNRLAVGGELISVYSITQEQRATAEAKQ